MKTKRTNAHGKNGGNENKATNVGLDIFLRLNWRLYTWESRHFTIQIIMNPSIFKKRAHIQPEYTRHIAYRAAMLIISIAI